MTKSNVEKEVFILSHKIHHLIKSGQGLKSGNLQQAEAEIMTEHCFLAMLFMILMSYYLLPLRTTYPGLIPPTVGLTFLDR